MLRAHLTRREFAKICLAMGMYHLFPAKKAIALVEARLSTLVCEGQHHRQNGGFRNYPVIPEPEKVPITFYFNRFMEEFRHNRMPSGFVTDPKQAHIDFSNRMKTGKDTITWIGHSTFIFTISGINILIDPFFSKRASPVEWAGPKRYTPPGIAAKALLQIDCILVSHNHYDHLDENTLKKLRDKEKIKVIAPLGLRTFFEDMGYVDIEALDWWQTIDYRGKKFTALPTIHSSGRGIKDKNQSLWCSWAIQEDGVKYYYAGDTAYSKTIFREIGRVIGGFNLAILPIGGYAPRKQMKYNHVTPEEAVQIGLDTGSEIIVPCHWGTISLSSEPYFEPPERFLKKGTEKGFSPENLWVMKIGETRQIPGRRRLYG